MEEESIVSKMKLRDILKNVDIQYIDIDISFFCDDFDIVEKFNELIEKDIDNNQILNFLIENETKIDKEKLVLYVYTKLNNTRRNIIKEMYKEYSSIEDRLDIKKILGVNLKIKNIEDFKKQILQNKTRREKLFGILEILVHSSKFSQLYSEKIDRLLTGNRAIAFFEKQIINCEEFLKDVDINIIKIGDNGEKIILEITNSQEEVEKQKKERKGDTKKSNKACPELARINKLSKQISSDDKGLEYIIQGVLLDDLKAITDDEIVAVNVKEVVALNSLIRDGKYTIENIATIKDFDPDTYAKLVNSVSSQSYIDELSDAIRQYAKFIDVDKLLMVALYRFQEIMEKREITGETYEVYKYLYAFIKDNIQDKDLSIKVQLKEDASKEIDFSYKDIEEFMKGLLEERYVSKEELKTTREDILSGNKMVQDVSIEMLKVLDFSNEELEIIMNNSIENTIYLAELAKLKEEAIYTLLLERNPMSEDLLVYFMQNNKISMDLVIDLYINGKIDLDFFKNHSNELNIPFEITINKINKEYLSLKKYKGKDKEERTKKLDAKIEIYKAINLEEKTDEELEELSNEVMYEIAEDFEDDEDILFYYSKGLITLETVAEWSGEGIIDRLYSDSQINISQIEDLYLKEKVSRKFIEDKILNDDMDIGELIEYMKKGYISNPEIIKIFQNSEMYKAELEEKAKELLDLGIISKHIYEIITQRDLEKLEGKAGHGFSQREPMKELIGCEIPWEIQVSKKEMRDAFKDEDKDVDTTTPPTVGGKNSKIISPRVRYEFLKLLQCNIPNIPYEKIGEDNPFYNYNFYIIQEEILGEKPLRDAIIVIERFFKNRERAMDNAGGDIEAALEDVSEWSTDNATYIMNYEDYLVLQGKQKELGETSKRTVVREVEGAIYTANHRSGSWAVSMLYKIAQAKAGKTFDEYKGDERTGQVIDWLRTLYTEEELEKIIRLMKQIDDEAYSYEEKNGTYRLVDSGYDFSDDSEER